MVADGDRSVVYNESNGKVGNLVQVTSGWLA